MCNLTPFEITQLKSQYPIGTRVALVSMHDEQAPPIGTLGTVCGIDDAGHILMKWDSGSSLSLIPKIDEWRIVERKSLTQFISEHPNCSFDLFTPCGFTFLKPQDVARVLKGEGIKGHLGDGEPTITITGQELMNQYIFRIATDSDNDRLFHILTCFDKSDYPTEK